MTREEIKPYVDWYDAIHYDKPTFKVWFAQVRAQQKETMRQAANQPLNYYDAMLKQLD